MARIAALLLLVVGLASGLGGCTLVDQRTFDADAGKPPVIPQPPGPPAPKPLITIDFSGAHPDYAEDLRQAVEGAMARKHTVAFEVATVVPNTGTPAQQVAAATGLTPDARDVARAINADGVDDDKIKLTARAVAGVASRQVQVFVQ